MSAAAIFATSATAQTYSPLPAALTDLPPGMRPSATEAWSAICDKLRPGRDRAALHRRPACNKPLDRRPLPRISPERVAHPRANRVDRAPPPPWDTDNHCPSPLARPRPPQTDIRPALETERPGPRNHASRHDAAGPPGIQDARTPATGGTCARPPLFARRNAPIATADRLQ